MTEKEAVIQLRTAEPMSDPRVRFERGSVRAWFPDIEEDARLEVPGDGAAISRLRLRPGASGTALLMVELGDKRKLSPQDVSIEPHAGGAMIRIARAVLAEVAPKKSLDKPAAPSADRGAKSAAPVADGAKLPAGPAPAAGTSSGSPLARGVHPALQTSANAATNGDHAAASVGPQAGAAAKKPLSLSSLKHADKSSDDGEASEDDSQNPTAALLAVTAVLALIYGFVRVFGARRTRRFPDASIEVIGTRRLGTRHQLVLVRALGEDHLLSMNGERTERIASTPSPGSQAATLKLLPPPRKAAPASLMRALDEAAQDDDRPEPDKPREAPFGAELLQFMQKRANPSWAPAESGRAPRGDSPAVAGLMRLRGRAAS